MNREPEKLGSSGYGNSFLNGVSVYNQTEAHTRVAYTATCLHWIVFLFQNISFSTSHVLFIDSSFIKPSNVSLDNVLHLK